MIDTAVLATASQTSQSVIRATAPKLIASEVVTLDRNGQLTDGPGTRRRVYPEGGDKLYVRAWVHDVDEDHWRRYRLPRLVADNIVKQQDSLGRLELRSDERALRARLAERRLIFLRKRAGARPKTDLRKELRAIAADVVAEHRVAGDLAEISATSLLAEVGLVAWQHDLEGFQERYPAARRDPDSPACGYRNSIQSRVRGLVGPDVKALLSRQK